VSDNDDLNLTFEPDRPTFESWPKIARLNRKCVISEKIDGTNAAVIVEPFPDGQSTNLDGWCAGVTYDRVEGVGAQMYLVGAQSRKQVITPSTDNFGFAAWVRDNASELASALGAGRHFGEWWGSGIQRGYGLTKGEKRFSLFNVNRYADADLSKVPALGLVPVLYDGPFSTEAVNQTLQTLAANGSAASPGFAKPEGIIVFHVAAQVPFKVTIEKDEAPKGANNDPSA
jgi:hypothetical protein